MEVEYPRHVVSLLLDAEKLTLNLLKRGAARFGVPVPRVDVRFNLRGQTAGQARFPSRGRPVIRYNPQLLVENAQRFLERTVPHEAAHVIAHRVHGPGIRPHGEEWRDVMRFFGADSSRCHDYDTSRAKTRSLARYPYHCACREHTLTSIRHNRALAGQAYLCRDCGAALNPGSRP